MSLITLIAADDLILDPTIPPEQALARAGNRVGTYIVSVWRARAQQHGLRDTGPGSYVGGITDETEVATNPVGDTGYEVVIMARNRSKHARYVEDGHGAYHLPDVINWNSVSGKIKQGKKGKYLHIPFRHYTPGDLKGQGATLTHLRSVMPDFIYAEAKKLARTMRANAGAVFAFEAGKAVTFGRGPSARGQYEAFHAGQPVRVEGQLVTGARYVRADDYLREPVRKRNHRLDRSDVPAMIQIGPGGGADAFEERRSARNVPGSGVNPAWSTSRWDNLIRSAPFGEGKTTHGSQYITVRTLTQTSAGWHIPAQAGKGIARDVQSALANDPAIAKIIGTAIQEVLASQGVG